MRMPKRGEKGFTLIELLIVVAILGVLAAIIIPNVIRFLGKGEEEAQNTEYNNVVAAVAAMMADNNLTSIPNPVTVRTNDMTAFPDATADNTSGKVTDPDGTSYTFPGDQVGYVLYQHDITADAAATGLVNYITLGTSEYYYTIDAAGNVTQYDAGGTQLNP